MTPAHWKTLADFILSQVHDLRQQAANTVKQEENVPRRPGPGGFAVLPPWARDYVDTSKPSDLIPEEDLAESAASWKPRVKPELLRAHEWAPEPITDLDQGLSSIEEDDNEDVHQEGSLKRKVVKNEEQDENESNEYGPHTNTASSATEEGDNADQQPDCKQDFSQSGSPSKRARTVIPSGPSRTHRKSVCVHCWLTSGLCNGSGQCRTCRQAGTRCVRKLCRDGERCFSQRCPCLHPGEWDVNDTSCTVEAGDLPVKIRGGDFYRPPKSEGQQPSFRSEAGRGW